MRIDFMEFSDGRKAFYINYNKKGHIAIRKGREKDITAVGLQLILEIENSATHTFNLPYSFWKKHLDWNTKKIRREYEKTIKI